MPPLPCACCQQVCESLPERLEGQQSQVSWVRRDLQALEYNQILEIILPRLEGWESLQGFLFFARATKLQSRKVGLGGIAHTVSLGISVAVWENTYRTWLPKFSLVLSHLLSFRLQQLL